MIDYKEIVIILSQHDSFTYELTIVVTTSIRPVHVLDRKKKTNPSTEKGIRHELPNLTKKLLAADSC